MARIHVETAMSAALSRAGVNTAEYRLRMLASDALKKHHRNISRALPTFEAAVDDDPDLIREALLHFLCRIDAEPVVAGHANCDTHIPPAGDHHPPLDTQNSGAVAVHNGAGQLGGDTPASAARPVVEPSAAQTATDLSIKTRIAVNSFDRELTRTGQRWGNVYYSELSNMTEDGDIAHAIRMHIGSLRGKEALKPIRDLMTPREFAILINKVRKERM